jgi:hypothetical protein
MVVGFLVQKSALKNRQVASDDEAIQVWAVNSRRVYAEGSYTKPSTKQWWHNFVQKAMADRQATDGAMRLFGRVEFRETSPELFEIVAKLSTQVNGNTIEVIDGRFYMDTVCREAFFSSILGIFMLSDGSR